MTRVFGFLKHRWVIAVLGLLAVALVIWLAGPLLAFAGREPLASPVSRLLAIGLVVLLWVLRRVLARFKAGRANEQLVKDMVGAQAPAPSETEVQSEEELAELGKRFDEALQVLKKARLGGAEGRQHLYQLPWYVIIGPPGSGKTTALAASGLHFPLGDRFGEQSKVRGVGGTRNCDWWFTDEAVLLDTAGRYTTQDSHQEVDRAAWLGFLGLLKKHRPRRPINGVLVAVSVADLLQQTETEREAHVRAIRRRIQELQEQLRVRFPVYVLFTKCDLVAGFVEFFEDLGREGRAQVWGVSFPRETLEDPNAAVASLGTEISALEERLNARLLARLQTERDLGRRDLIYAFPHQLALLKASVEGFVGEVFRATRFEDAPVLRGVYFTSGTQEGTPVDRLMGALARSFGLGRQALGSFSGPGRSYFITRLFRDVIFKEAALAGSNLRAEAQRAWLQRGAYAGAAALTLLAAAGWLTSYYRNLGYVDTVSTVARGTQTKLDALPPGERSLTTVLPILNAVRDVPGGYGARDAGAPVLMRLGLYQGDKLGSQATSAYRRLLGDLLLPVVVLRLEEQLRGGQGQPGAAHEGLKVYLMLGDRAHFDRDAVKAWVLLDWQQQLPRSMPAEQREQLQAHLDALLEALPDPLPFPLDGGLVAEARAPLAKVPLAGRIYARLKQGQYGKAVPGLRVADAAGRDAALVFVRKSGEPLSKGVPGLFTYAGYHEVFQKQALLAAKDLVQEGWVLSSEQAIPAQPEKLAQLVDDVRALYFKDYVSQWEALLADVDIVAFTGPKQAVEVLGILAGKDSPLKKLLVAVARETRLEHADASKKEGVAEAADALSAVKDRLARLLQTQPAGPTEPQAAPRGNPVDERFAPLHRLVEGEAGGPAPIDATLAQLDELYVQLNSIASALDRGGTALEAAGRQAGMGSAVGQVRAQAQRQPAPLNEWLQAVGSRP